MQVVQANVEGDECQRMKRGDEWWNGMQAQFWSEDALPTAEFGASPQCWASLSGVAR